MSSERKPPEQSPEASSEAPGSNWISMSIAAGIIGVSERAARDWVKRHEIPTRGERPVMVDEAAVIRKLSDLGRSPRQTPETSRETPGSTSEPIDAAFRVRGEDGEPPTALVPLSTVMEQAQSWADRYAEIAERNEVLALEVGQLRERTGRQASDLVAAQARIVELEAEIEAVRKPPEVVQAPASVTTADVDPPPRRWRWWPFGRD